jgi:fluoride exporter
MRVTRFELRRLGAIYVGGMFGALVRVGLAEGAPQGLGEWPWATFAVNMVGALLLGYFVARLRDHPEDGLVHPFLTTGICGTLTTFSTLQLELFELVDGGHLWPRHHLCWRHARRRLRLRQARHGTGAWPGDRGNERVWPLIPA